MADNVCGDRAVSFVKHARTVPKKGVFVEVGVFEGNSAVIIASVAVGRVFHLYDSWEGLPELKPVDQKKGHKGQFKADFHTTSTLIDSLKCPSCKTIYHNGLVQDTFKKEDYPGGIAFLHIDVDLYEATRFCLENFYPLVLNGGIVQVDDYGLYPGCKKAVRDYCYPRKLILNTVYKQPAPVYFVKGE